ncbi:phospholipase D-like domain-containing protein [Cyanothece sp. BG0011]|uniref:phospholipase D-like domain-containing protein n=1 Tax=Cyanothece sp. BG0011 TaxID=2082950 RepID=UPI000D1F632F|nr:phospholipase D-like domain-containing protein [Cyanothece sp. BG0011]
MDNKYEHYIKSIDRRWKKEVKQATDKIFVLSPYITSRTADVILNNVKKTEICEIYTVFSVNNFISSSSSIHTIKRLYEKGFNLYHLEKLHAKIILIPNQFASIGSQNLTYNGVRNKEASIIITDSLKIQDILEELKKWFLQRSIITESMINEMEDNFIPLQDKFFELQQEAAALENSIWDNEYKRIQDF